MSGRDQKLYDVLIDDTTTSSGRKIFVGDFRHCDVFLDNDSDTALTVKFLASMGDTAPDFDTTQSASNIWDFVNAVDLEDDSNKDGDTGIVMTAADHRHFEINTNNLRWLTAKVTARNTAGSKVNVKFVLANNK